MTKVENVWLKVDGNAYGWDKEALCKHLQDLIDGLNNSPFPVVVMRWEFESGGFRLFGFEDDPIPAEAIIPIDHGVSHD